MKVLTVIDKIKEIKEILVKIATGTPYKDNIELQNKYKQLRQELITNPQIKGLLPNFISSCRDLSEFWGFIRSKYGEWSKRRMYLKEEFDPILSAIENHSIGSPSDTGISNSLKNLNSDEVNSTWRKAMDRRSTDPEGALTIARTLLESTLKHILDDLGDQYKEDEDLQQLYRKVASRLSLAPSKETTGPSKQLLSGCISIIFGITTIRNKLSDAHGKGRTSSDLDDRHAEFGVNIAGALSVFIVKTFESLKKDT